MKTPFHCPYSQSKQLQQALASDKAKIAFLLGAGCPVSISVTDEQGTRPLIPDIRGLTKKINDQLSSSDEFKAHYAALLNRFSGGNPAEPTIEDILSHIRALHDVMRNGSIDGLDKGALEALDTEICRITTTVVGVDLPEGNTPYQQLATWIRGIPRAHPVEVFTPNYDLLVEQALEVCKIPYFDGFVGSRQAFFDLTAMESDSLPPRWTRLWKVHGSVNWWRQRVGKSSEEFEVVRTTDKPTDNGRQMIYPSHLKYDQSRRLPYLAMLDRLRDFLARGQSVLVTSGYSFGDQHLNEVILHGLRSNPTAICFGLLFGARSTYVEALTKAQTHPNLSLLAADGAVLGTLEQNWRVDELADHPMHGISVAKADSSAPEGEPPKSCKFLLGDFKHLGGFLAQQLSREDEKQENSSAS